MSETGTPKKPLAVDVIATQPRRDTYDPSEHGHGSPPLQPGELQKSAAWKAHKSSPSPATKEQKSDGPVQPPKKSA